MTTVPPMRNSRVTFSARPFIDRTKAISLRQTRAANNLIHPSAPPAIRRIVARPILLRASSTPKHGFHSTAIAMSCAESNSANAASGSNDTKEELPPLSAQDFRIYNALAERMDQFHEHFRQSWTLLWKACTDGQRPRNMTLKQFLDEGLQFGRYLTMHHGIEERHFFPMLAKRMPEFDPRRGDLVAQHKEIHEGLEQFEAYLKGCKNRDHEFDLAVLREKMESWGGVLWTHLDEEVKTLGAENMRRYWSKEDMMRMPI